MSTKLSNKEIENELQKPKVDKAQLIKDKELSKDKLVKK